MAISGSGKFVKIMGGVLSFGTNNTTHAEIYRDTTTYSGNTYYGITCTGTYFSLSGLNELVIGTLVAYTGTIRMYTLLYMEPNLIGDTYVNAYSEEMRFVNGFFVGPA